MDRGCPPTRRPAASSLGENPASGRPLYLQAHSPHPRGARTLREGPPPTASIAHTRSVCNRHVSFLERMHVFPVGFTNNFKFYCFLSLMNSQKHVTSSPVMNVERQARRARFPWLN